jgi:hypothetical protein
MRTAANPIGDLLSQLDNWANLLQGALGSLIGALAGGLFALWIARVTTRGELNNQRQVARELKAQEHCSTAVPILRDLHGKASIARLLATPMPERIAINSSDFATPLRQLREFLRTSGPELPKPLEQRLDALLLPGLLAESYANVNRPHGDIHPSMTDTLGALVGATEALQGEVAEYLRDPVPVLNKWEREDRNARRRLRFATIWWRVSHPLGGGRRPILHMQIGEAGVRRVVTPESGSNFMPPSAEAPLGEDP